MHSRIGAPCILFGPLLRGGAIRIPIAALSSGSHRTTATVAVAATVAAAAVVVVAVAVAATVAATTVLFAFAPPPPCRPPWRLPFCLTILATSRGAGAGVGWCCAPEARRECDGTLASQGL